jgi:hypothetical protein
VRGTASVQSCPGPAARGCSLSPPRLAFAAAASLCVAALCPVSTGAQSDWSTDDAGERKSIQVPRGVGPPHLDGLLDDPQWAQAAALTDLTLYLPVPGQTPRLFTRFLFYYDDEALYLGADLRDDDPQQIIHRQLIQNQQVFNDDHVQVIIDPFDTKRGGYLFYVNPNGVQRDGLLFGQNRFNMNWDGIWQAKAQVTEKGWSAEFQFPFKTLAFDPQQTSWGANVMRIVRRSGEEAAWSFRDAYPTLDANAQLRGMAGIKPGRGLDIVPSASLSQRQEFSPNASDVELKPSLDVFYRLTPALTASLTLNTDFSATEVDDRQVNLTRFSLFFPEKRDFFLQDADIFEFAELTQNGRPFFSRTIGLSASGEPVDLIGGGKITGRVGPWTVGAFGVEQEDYQDVSAGTIGVARVYRQILADSTLGAIATYGDPNSNLDNSLLGVDFQYRNTRWFPGRSVEGELWYQHSDTQGIDTGQDAYGLRVRYPNDRLSWLLGVTELGENFNPALGFVNRPGIRDYTAELGYRFRFPNGWVRSYAAFLKGEEIRDLNDSLETRIAEFQLAELYTRQSDKLDLIVRRQEEVLVEPFNLLDQATIAPGRYRFDRYRLQLETPGFRVWSTSLSWESGEFFDGDRRDGSVQVAYRPNARLNLDLTYTANLIDLPEASFATRIVSLKANIAFNVEWAWINFIQYDNVSDRLGVNSRLRWIPRQGQELFFVVNYDFTDPQETRDFRSDLRETTVKFSYTFRY